MTNQTICETDIAHIFERPSIPPELEARIRRQLREATGKDDEAFPKGGEHWYSAMAEPDMEKFYPNLWRVDYLELRGSVLFVHFYHVRGSGKDCSSLQHFFDTYGRTPDEAKAKEAARITKQKAIK